MKKYVFDSDRPITSDILRICQKVRIIMERNVVDRIHSFNQGRKPELVKLKYELMRGNAFVFFRGSCHLFYEDWPKNSPLNQAPAAWSCGDLHLENFGSYKGDNRLAYFDINDFDEGILAPCTWDVTRLVTSILVAAHTLKLEESEALALCYVFLDSYTTNLVKGKARTVEKETAEGMVKDHLESLKQRTRKDFLDKRTEEKKGKRRFIIDNDRFEECSEEKREKITAMLNGWASKQEEPPEFFKVLDVAERIAGTGSLGIPRYAILIEGKGSPDCNYILDLKQSQPSSLQPYVNVPQPQWNNEAQRIVAIQQRMQGTPPALLAEMSLEDKSYVLRELQPIQDKVNLGEWNGKLGRLSKVLRTMGQLTAWDQLRSTGRQGSAIADDLIAFATEKSSDWRNAVLDYAKSYSLQVDEDYAAFCQIL